MVGGRDFALNTTSLTVSYRPQRKVMFSEASVCSQGEGWADPLGRRPCQKPPCWKTPWRQTYHRQTPYADTPEGGSPVGRPPCRQTLKSSGGHCSGRYASHWNAFFFKSLFALREREPMKLPSWYYETYQGLSSTNLKVCIEKLLNNYSVFKFHVQNGISIVPLLMRPYRGNIDAVLILKS